jgi:hypothetical protein
MNYKLKFLSAILCSILVLITFYKLLSEDAIVENGHPVILEQTTPALDKPKANDPFNEFLLNPKKDESIKNSLQSNSVQRIQQIDPFKEFLETQKRNQRTAHTSPFEVSKP